MADAPWEDFEPDDDFDPSELPYRLVPENIRTMDDVRFILGMLSFRFDEGMAAEFLAKGKDHLIELDYGG